MDAKTSGCWASFITFIVLAIVFMIMVPQAAAGAILAMACMALAIFGLVFCCRK